MLNLAVSEYNEMKNDLSQSGAVGTKNQVYDIEVEGVNFSLGGPYICPLSSLPMSLLLCSRL